MSKIPKEYMIAVDAIVKASIKIMKIYNESFDVEIKSDGSPLTIADIESSKIIEALLQETQIPITGEETKKGDYEIRKTWKKSWCVDPLDGTTNFIHGLPSFGISIALANHQEILCGIVLEPNQNECFWAYKNGGAFLNENPISVSKTNSIEAALFATGFPINNHEKITNYLEIAEYLIKNSRGLRRIGSASIDLVYTAMGRFDAFYEYNLKPWDVAAGAIIVQESGGSVTDFSGKQNWLYGQTLIASNSKIHESLLEIIKKTY